MPKFTRKQAKPSVITLADRARDAGEWKLAVMYYQIALRRKPKNPPIWVQYGHVLKEAGHLAEAERAYRTALAYDPCIADSHLQLGHVLKTQGKNEEARTAYMRAFALDSSLNGASFEFALLGWSEAHFSELRGMLGTDTADPSALATANRAPPEHSAIPPVHPRVRTKENHPMAGIRVSAESIITDPRIAWVKHQIWPPECLDIIREIRSRKCKTGLEIGVSSGFSSAIIYAAIADNTETPVLYAFDRLTKCNFDETRRIGDAFYQIHGPSTGYRLTTNAISADISDIPEIDFAFIDANHRHPWPALDLLAIWHHLKPEAVVAFHDISLIFKEDMPKDLNGARDVVRAWVGEKWFSETTPDIAFCRNTTEEVAARSIAAALMMDWDVEVDPNVLFKYRTRVNARFGEPGCSALLAALDSRSTSSHQRQRRFT